MLSVPRENWRQGDGLYQCMNGWLKLVGWKSRQSKKHGWRLKIWGRLLTLRLIGYGLNFDQLGRRLTSFGKSFSELMIRSSIPRCPLVECRRRGADQAWDKVLMEVQSLWHELEEERRKNTSERAWTYKTPAEEAWEVVTPKAKSLMLWRRPSKTSKASLTTAEWKPGVSTTNCQWVRHSFARIIFDLVE